MKKLLIATIVCVLALGAARLAVADDAPADPNAPVVDPNASAE
jgi:hypothetical protein